MRNAGFGTFRYAADGQSLLRTAQQMRPRVVIAASRLPALSGLEFTRLVRVGHANLDPALSIIVLTTTPTTAFLEAARESGVDEMLVCPFAPAALLARVEAVLIRPRRFVRSECYVGPCRRRRMLQDYGGEFRRESDAISVPTAPWEAEANRALVHESVTEILECAESLAPDDVQLKVLAIVTEKTARLAEEMEDRMLAGARVSAWSTGLSPLSTSAWAAALERQFQVELSRLSARISAASSKRTGAS